MLWVVRAGQKSIFYERFITEKRVYIPWEGYNIPLNGYNNREDFRTIVQIEKKTQNRTSVSNWSGQLYSFVVEMKIGDLVLIPTQGSHTYTLAKIRSDYLFRNDGELFHYRNIELLDGEIPRKIFSQQIIYSLGTFRTLFKVKQEDEIMDTISKWRSGR